MVILSNSTRAIRDPDPNDLGAHCGSHDAPFDTLCFLIYKKESRILEVFAQLIVIDHGIYILMSFISRILCFKMWK